MPYKPDYNTRPSGGGMQPGATGSQLRRPYMGGIAGPAARPPKDPSMAGSNTGSFGMSTTSSGGGGGVNNKPVTPGYDFGNKGGGAYFPNGNSGGGNAGGNNWQPPTQQGQMTTNRARPTGVQAPMYGGFNPSQMTQQNGQWGMMGRGGNFQALGGNALQRWLAQQSQQQPTAPPQQSPPQQAGYVTPQQWDDWTRSGANNWFTQGEGAAGHPTDYNAFNQWFQNSGQQYDPTAWARLYGNAGTPPANTGNGNGVYWTT